MRDEERALVGTCECGTVRYRVADAFRYAANCHCSCCRALWGRCSSPSPGSSGEKLEITHGAGTRRWSTERTASTTRAAAYAARFCSRWCSMATSCTSPWARSPTLPAFCSTLHIFVGSKAPWFEITDDLPQFERHVR